MRSLQSLLIFWIMGSALAFSQPIYVVGNIMEEESGEPIPYATFYTKSGKKLGQSNSKGRFEIEVITRKALLVIKRHGYKEIELDLSEEPELIDLEIYMESMALRRRQLEIDRKRVGRSQGKTRSMEELEQFQGMRIDLNDHLRQLDGVSGMGEYSSDISVYGSRTGDVTHYLGQLKIPNIRHLDFGLPGNQSALNPRLLKSVSVEDNLSQGPLGQGNASALQYELKPGDPENLTGDIVFGTFNREFNASTYWGDRTIVASVRFLQNTFLANLGGKYFTLDNDNKHTEDCPKEGCERLEDPIDVQSSDIFLGTMYSDSTGYSSKLTMLFVGDDYEIQEDLSGDPRATSAKIVEEGDVVSSFGAYEVVNPIDQGEFLFSLGALLESSTDKRSDTSFTDRQDLLISDWPYQDDGESVMGSTDKSKWGFYNRSYWDMNKKIFGGRYGYGAELAYKGETRDYIDSLGNENKSTKDNMVNADVMFRQVWDLKNKRQVYSTVGVHLVDANVPSPLLGLRYSIPLAKNFTGYLDGSLRQHTEFKGGLRKGKIEAFTTPSAGLKSGLSGNWGAFTLSHSYYTRYYHAPQVPEPEVYWNYLEKTKADYALVFGTNLNTAWEPWHHFGMNFNGSIVQGDYYLKNGSHLAWEANRSLDFVSNIRVVPRKDSLLSIILTYVVNNDVPLYEYQLGRAAQSLNSSLITDTQTRTVRQSKDYKTVSRQRVDIRINLDLNSKWKPLDGTRFYFQGSNLFSDFDNGFFSYLGGNNEKQRGWTRLADDNRGKLSPLVINGLGLFILFGFEMDFSI